MTLPVDVEFRLRAAARVLERAAGKTSDPELKRQLEALATSLRRAAEGDLNALWDVEKAAARAKTVDDMVKELREWIWKTGSTRRQEAERQMERNLLDPLERFERFLDELDRKLAEVLP